MSILQISCYYYIMEKEKINILRNKLKKIGKDSLSLISKCKHGYAPALIGLEPGRTRAVGEFPNMLSHGFSEDELDRVLTFEGYGNKSAHYWFLGIEEAAVRWSS